MRTRSSSEAPAERAVLVSLRGRIVRAGPCERREDGRDSRELLHKVVCAFVEADYACDADSAAFQVLDAALYPLRSHAYGCEAVDSRFRAEVIDLTCFRL